MVLRLLNVFFVCVCEREREFVRGVRGRVMNT